MREPVPGTLARRDGPQDGHRAQDGEPADEQPLRQITGGLRSILYYDAQADAGLTRGWVMMAVGLAMAALFGFGITGWYDRKGLHLIPVETTPAKTAATA